METLQLGLAHALRILADTTPKRTLQFRHFLQVYRPMIEGFINSAKKSRYDNEFLLAKQFKFELRKEDKQPKKLKAIKKADNCSRTAICSYRNTSY